ncbi:hypothetical protein like AT1G19980 [Hibiscus trionum]|uniref:Uncharacterized protein n=1 Tax=Hibiscus trionum TaxID=183268 RepID=A0A9W7IWS9_HIBTR|nr:hypothetical protein like AT1G19980 [Hibiscus trionum]
MGTKTRVTVSSEREKWDKIFECLVKMLKSQQQHLETLAQERKVLEDRIKLQYERWASDVRLYESHISQMKTELESKEMACVLEAAKADLIVGLKHREVEETNDELCDFRVCFDILSKNSKDVPEETEKGMPRCKDCGSKFITSTALEGDLRKLKLEYENLASQKSSQIAALMAENKFAWNQLNILESQYTDKLNSKHSELEKANRKIEVLISNMEDLSSSVAEKNEINERLKSEVSQKEADANRLNEEVSKLSREVELLRKSRNFSCTPVIRRCSEGGRTSVLRGENGGRDGFDGIMKKEKYAHVPDLLKDSGKGSRSLKRKKDEEIPISRTPKLFSSTFKVPRVKASSPNTS